MKFESLNKKLTIKGITLYEPQIIKSIKWKWLGSEYNKNYLMIISK